MSKINAELISHVLDRPPIISTRSPSAFFIRAVWFSACLVPGIFLFCLFALIFYAAPEHDDFCFLYGNAHDGFVQTMLSFYSGWTGRIVPLLLLQLPAEIAKDFGIGLLPAYSITLAIGMVAFISGSVVAITRAFPGLPVQITLFLGIAFTAAILGATPSVHDLLYWLPALVCYVPAGIVSILILGECVRALVNETEFSWLTTFGMAVGGFVAAMCNEFTAVWLVGMLASSLLARLCLGQKLQISHHALIAGVILFGWAIVVLAPGNSTRLVATGGARDLAFVIPRAFNYALIDLGRFLLSPTVIAWSVVVIAVTLAEPVSVRPPNPRGALIGFGAATLSLFCCYFEYLAHHFTTGVRLVERAQNEALILLFFTITLSISLLIRTYRRELRQRFAFADSLSLESVALPVILAGLVAASIYASSTGILLRAESDAFYPFWLESAARDSMLSSSPEPTVTVQKHRWTPSVLTNSDVTDNTGCIASYYHKSKIVPTEPPTL